MRYFKIFLFATLFLYSCQSSEEQSSKEETDKQVEKDSKSDKKVTQSILRKTTDSNIDLAKRAWASFCKFPSSNTDLILNKRECIFSYCSGESDSDWNQYLLLEKKGSSKSYKKIVFKKRERVAKLEEYYGFPSFTPQLVRAIDINGDKQEEVLIQIHVSGKSSGAGAEEETFWDEDFYEVYELQKEEFVFSKVLTAQYTKSLASQQKSFDVSDIESTTKHLQPLLGEYFETAIINSKPHWKKCYGLRLEISIKEDAAQIWVDSGMDGYPLTIKQLKGDGQGKIYLSCEAAANLGLSEDITKDFIYEAKDKLHWLIAGEAKYLLSTDQSKIPPNPNICEDADEGY